MEVLTDKELKKKDLVYKEAKPKDKDVQNLDDVLPKYLLTFGIQTF